jgi:16S rRNA processing protein RimM
MPDTTWLPIATLLRPQGRRGELLSEPLTDLPEIFQPGREVYLAAAGAPTPAATPVTLEDAWHPTGKNAGRVVLKLSHSNSITEAETLAGKQLLIPADALPQLDADTYFVGDLIGCTLHVVSEPDAAIPAGTIVEVQFATAPDGRTRLEDAAPLLGVETTPGEEPILIPFVRAWLVSVDIAAKRVVMNLPPGLLTDLDPPIGDDVEDTEQH